MKLTKGSTHSGFTLVEVMVVVAIIALLSAMGGLGFKTVRDHARAKACVANQDRIWAAKRAAWTRYEDLSTRADPEGDIIAFLDEKSLLFCPNPGTHRPSGSDVATRAHVLASYNLAATSEDTRPTCRIDGTHVHE